MNKLAKLSYKSIPEFISGSSTKVVSSYYNKETLFNKQPRHLVEDPETLKQVQGDSVDSGIPMTTTTGRGFTLIELLVVVLIIGILAAVALPQYQKAVWRARNVQLKTLVSAVGKAQQAYYLANGTYAESLNQLDVSLPPWPSKTNHSEQGNCGFTTTFKEDAVRYTDSFLIGIQQTGGIIITWMDGPYKCGGFRWDKETGEVRCAERHSASFSAGAFCEKLEHATYDSQPSTWRWYNY